MMTHHNNAKIKLANGACAGGVPINLRRLNVFQEPKHPPQQLLFKNMV